MSFGQLFKFSLNIKIELQTWKFKNGLHAKTDDKRIFNFTMKITMANLCL